LSIIKLKPKKTWIIWNRN